MDNVIAFPAQPRISQFLAEEYIANEMRQRFGACVGLLHGSYTYDDLMQIAGHMKEVAALIESAVGIREACK